ncbi:LysR family transcriptional regulator [Pseudomonas mosselii]|uniref:LysR family transcriptional regulator n=1 Tax=Pseudomonas mosselii TaxID=78327 RepID=UPI001F4BE29A|nr:LysR family transcriptional regulator [Pseudomonas mosselii]MCH7417813.1 LysR family transcriptional regulator [Pseudomonas mosselii]
MKINMYRELEVFRAVMLAGSTSMASKMLEITQPAVSQQIKKLESKYDVVLFERNRGRLVPTREAHALMEEVETFFNGLAMLDHKLRSLKSSVKSSLRLAVHPAYGNFLAPMAIARFRQKFDVPVFFEVSSSASAYQRVHSGEIDFGIIANEIETKDCEQYNFCSARGLIVSPPGLIGGHVKALTTSDLLKYPFVAMNAEDHTRLELEAHMGAAAKQLDIAVQTPYALTVCELVAQGVGVGLAHPIVASSYLPDKLEARLLDKEVRFTSKLIFRKDSRLSLEAKELIRLLRIQLEGDIKRLDNLLGFSVLN